MDALDHLKNGVAWLFGLVLAVIGLVVVLALCNDVTPSAWEGLKGLGTASSALMNSYGQALVGGLFSLCALKYLKG